MDQTPHTTNQRSRLVQREWEKVLTSTDMDVEKVKKILPLGKVKKIIKSDPEIHMLNDEAAVLMIKLCEMFCIDLSLRAWHHRTEGRTLEKSNLNPRDLVNIIDHDGCYDFLRDIPAIATQRALAKQELDDSYGAGAAERHAEAEADTRAAREHEQRLLQQQQQQQQQ
jgi:nuclear transcription factor Y gamma